MDPLTDFEPYLRFVQMISPAPGQGFWPDVRLAFAYCVSFGRLDPSVQKCRTAVCRYYRLGRPASQKLQPR